MLVHKAIRVDVGRTNVVTVALGYDVSSDTITSEIRADDKASSELIASWDVTFATDGTDGALILTLDDSVTALITATTGYMDLKRVTGGEPVSVFATPLKVLFKGTVTA